MTQPKEQIPLTQLELNNPAFPLDYGGGSSDENEEVEVSTWSRGSLRESSTLPSGQEKFANLVRRLPSQRRNMADVVSNTMKSKNRKSVKHSKSQHFACPRNRDPEVLLNSQDFMEAPSGIQLHNVRSMTAALHTKKKFLEKLQTVDRRKKLHIGCCTRTKWSLQLAMKRMKYNLAELRYSAELWSSLLKRIEGHFGTGVASYFIFLRGLFYLNLVSMVFLLAFIVAPQLVYRFLQQEPPGYSQNVSFTGRELLTGEGWFLDTELYYGYYIDGVISAVPGLHYDMRYAYFCTCGVYYMVTVAILAVLVSRSYRRHYIEESQATSLLHISKVFCGWDYKITKEETALIHQKMSHQYLQEHLSKFRSETEARSCGMLCRLTVLRILANVLTLGILVGAGYLVWFISTSQSVSTDVDILKDFTMPLSITAINFVVPFGFSILGKLEQYEDPRVHITLTMLRTLTLNLVTLGVLLSFWFRGIDCSDVSTVMDPKWHDTDKGCTPCWENFMGQQIYRLVIVDFIFILVVTFLSEFMRRMAAQCCCKSLGWPEFDIGRNTLNLLYTQMLLWLGTFFSPLLSVINIIKLFIIFYVKSVSVLQNCRPSSKPWNAGLTSTLILLLLFSAFIGCFLAVAYSVAFVVPSQTCGPYQGYNSSYAAIYNVLDLWNAEDGNQAVKTVIELLTSTAFATFLVVSLGVIAYFCKVIANANGELVKRLHHQISLEGRDKKFLIQLLQHSSDQITDSCVGLATDKTKVRSGRRTAVMAQIHNSSSGDLGNQPQSPATSPGQRSSDGRVSSNPASPVQSPSQEHISRYPTSPSQVSLQTRSPVHSPSHVSHNVSTPGRVSQSPRAGHVSHSPSTGHVSHSPSTGYESHSPSPGSSPSRVAQLEAHRMMTSQHNASQHCGGLEPLHALEAQNPIYRDHSPTRHPDLPYNLPHYSKP